MKKTITKVQYGIVEIRDFDRDKCIEKNENLIITHNDKVMTLTPLDLKNKVMKTSHLIKSKFAGGKDYKLIGYLWKPTDESL